MEHTVWFVDEAVGEADAAAAVPAVIARLTQLQIILPTVCARGREHHPFLYPPGPGAQAITRGHDDVYGPYRGLLVCTERTIFHAGGNGLDALQCPRCSSVLARDGVPWDDAIQRWWDRTDEGQMRCPSCQASSSITQWQFCVKDREGYMPWNWAFGNLGFGFWNWAIEDRIDEEIAAALGRSLKIVYQAI